MSDYYYHHCQYYQQPPSYPHTPPPPYTLPQANPNSCWYPPWDTPTFSEYQQPRTTVQQQLVQATQPTCWEPDPPDGPPLYATDPDPPYSPPASAHHTRQGDFQQPPNYPNGPDPYAQPRYSAAGYHPWQTDAQADYPTEAILDRLLAALAIFETRLDTMDRRLDNLRPPAQPEPDPPYGLHDYGLTELGLLRTAATNTLGPQPYPGYPARQPDNQHQRTVFPATDLSALQTQPPQHACGQHHHQHQAVQPADAYWQHHHQHQQPVLDQQPPPQRSPSNHLRQAVSCLEQPAAVPQPLLQHPPSVWHPTSLCSATLHDPSSFPKTSVKGACADTWSFVSPSIPKKLHNLYKDELHDAQDETVDGLKDMSIYSHIGVKRMGEFDNKPFHDAMTRRFALKDVYIEYGIIGYLRTKQRSCPFDPGGIPRQSFSPLSTLFVASWFPP